MIPFSSLSYIERATHCAAPLAKKLFTLMETKKTNLALSADVTQSAELLQLAEELGPYICVLKTHIDIISDFTPALTQQLRKLAEQHHFLLFEDRKFADIGHTVQQQYAGGIYHIADWADITNAHALPGPSIIEGLAAVGRPKQRGLLLLAEMSSAGHLMLADYQQQTLRMAEKFPDFVLGFITQHALSAAPHWINMTPGVKLTAGKDHLGQQYVTVEHAVLQQGSDIIIVGRGITGEKNPLVAAKEYQQAAWEAYHERCQSHVVAPSF